MLNGRLFLLGCLACGTGFRSTGAPLAPKAGTSLKPDTESTSQEFINTGAPLAPRNAQALLPEWRFTMT